MSKRYKITKIVILSVVVLLAVLAGALFTASGALKKAKYLDPWKRDYAEQIEDPRVQLVAHGLLAANGHNMQPWKIRLDKQNPLMLYLYTDNERLALESDPLARQTLVSQGTFLEYMRVAGEHLGYETEIKLFPDGEYDEQKLSESMDQKPVAQITLSKVQPQANPLYEFMFLPDTNRMAYQPDALTPEQILGLQKTNTWEGLTLTVLNDKVNIEKLGAYGVEGTDIETGLKRMNDESAGIFRANEYQKNKYRYGFSFEGQGTTGLKKHLLQGMITIIPSFNNEEAATKLAVQATQTAVDHTPAYVLVFSKDNSRTSQVKAGMLYSRLILTAHEEGLVMQPLSQVLEEYPEMREPYSKIHKEYAPAGETIQFLIRVGKPTQDTPLSMRREVTDLIVE
ncbi:Nitroreductase family protein [Paenibacillus sophorae]|uniref:Nitroreductase family protein n=1 Tax=Paenibacillus sophorae TaxID=1333845 RepID=A0A1H8M7I3_9BACL|nr:nitroreductase family protein [Paenibacillus sophorae]QWU17697.1 nitroreductase family protein [Paenibacillus sophorae]SEO13106.1 Nitroreductase family protein [Paenibacillus sophorae]